MRIFIVSMDDPVYTIPFIKEVINKRKNDIIGVAVPSGNRMQIGKKRSKLVYLFTLLLIMGPVHFFRNTFVTLMFRARLSLSKKFSFISSPSLVAFAGRLGIPSYKINSPNDKEFLEILKNSKPDVIINQSQHILKKDFLCIPKIGVINRHNALLPKNRGRLSPFWVLFNNEKETAVSIHFVNDGIDSGDIIVQEKYEVTSGDNFNTLVKKNYFLAAKAMIKALDLLESNSFLLIPNDDNQATYNTVPAFRHALRYRILRILKIFK